MIQQQANKTLTIQGTNSHLLGIWTLAVILPVLKMAKHTVFCSDPPAGDAAPQYQAIKVQKTLDKPLAADK